jgi:hypothetical protein
VLSKIIIYLERSRRICALEKPLVRSHI